MNAAVGVVGWPGELERRIVGLLDPRRNTLTTTSRQVAFAIVCPFLVGGILLATTRFAVSDQPYIAPQGARSTEQKADVSDANDGKSAERFSGRVTGPDGKAVRGARIYILPLSESLNGELTRRTVTDALAIRATADGDGRFEFDAPDMVLTDLDGVTTNRRCFVIAAADGFGPDWMEILGRPRSSRIRTPVKGTDLALQLATDDVPIQGRFIDADGRPLSGARVELKQLMIPKQRDLNSYIDYVTQDGSAFANGPDYERTLFRPILIAELMTTTQTDADGRFELKGLGRERLAELKVTAPSVVDTSITVMTRDTPDIGTHRINGNPSQTTYGAKFLLQLKRGLTITGVVRDRTTQQPIPGMWVGWNSDPMNGLLSGEYSRMTDAKGRFTITGLDSRLLEWDQPHREIIAVSSPGIPYLPAVVEVKNDLEVSIECQPGIPFRMKLLDEQGQPVLADVTYREVQPNPHVPHVRHIFDGRWPVGRAAHRGGGIYEGFVLPGPGAVLVQTPGRSDYRPAHVDPKAFFAPGRTNWTAQERITAYGTQDTLVSSQAWVNQHDYAAIVLVNPSEDSKPLELSATIARDRPRRVSVVDPKGKPVVGVKTQGLTFHPYDNEPPLRSASFRLTGLNPDRAKRITFIEEKRQLIGDLLARDDGDAPYEVVMQPWGAVTGTLFDENDQPVKATLSLVGNSPLETNVDPSVEVHTEIQSDAQGRFRIDRLVPGRVYTAKIYRGIGMLAGTGFENLVVRPGEFRNLGSIRTTSPVDVRGQ